MSTENIDDSNWDASLLLEDPPNPQVSGTEQSYTVTDLEADTEYYFAIKALDAEENISDLSNVADASLMNDETAPSQVTDLLAEGDDNSAVLSWTAPGDDGLEGTASYYQIKIHTEEINDSNWQDASPINDPPDPQVAGSLESHTINDLTYYTDYYFALKAYDEVDNGSSLSNVAYTLLEEDFTAPAAISDLSVYSGYADGTSNIRIDWTATGDDGIEGNASYCEIKTSDSPIDDANWETADLAAIVTDPQSAGSSESFNVSGLTGGEVIYFAIKVYDSSGNASSVSNSPWGKIVFTINAGPCNGCGNCVYWCPEDAITDHGSWASIDYSDCDACGTCVNYCPRNAIHRYVINSW